MDRGGFKPPTVPVTESRLTHGSALVMGIHPSELPTQTPFVLARPTLGETWPVLRCFSSGWLILLRIEGTLPKLDGHLTPYDFHVVLLHRLLVSNLRGGLDSNQRRIGVGDAKRLLANCSTTWTTSPWCVWQTLNLLATWLTCLVINPWLLQELNSASCHSQLNKHLCNQLRCHLNVDTFIQSHTHKIVGCPWVEQGTFLSDALSTELTPHLSANTDIH